VKWIELSVEVHPEAVDAVAEVFRSHGTGGVAIEQPVSSDIEGERPPRPTGLPIMKAYLPVGSDTDEQVRRIEGDLWHLQAFGLSPVGELQRTEIAEEDWANAWKEHFHPLKVGRVVIKPTWREWDAAPDEIVVELDPGMAFGTGLHPTTQLVLAALQDRVRPGMEILDLGTGSGILAIAAARLGATVTALDISEIAVEVARENVQVNGLRDAITVSRGSIDAVSGRQFDVVFANIIASVLAELAPRLAAALRPGAELLGSGIVDERADLVRAAFTAGGLTLGEQKREGDWWLICAHAIR
jgi:ribosomal protein L11 methyltransferase